MNTGEDIQSLRKIADLSRLISLTILGIHVYLSRYLAFRGWGLTTDITDRLLAGFVATGLFDDTFRPKLAALVFLAISLLGIKGRKDEHIGWRDAVLYIGIGLSLYFAAGLVLRLPASLNALAGGYIIVTAAGYLLMLVGGTYLSRLIKFRLQKDTFNAMGETFPQEERLLENEYSVNLPAKYRLKDQLRDSWINFINPFRGLLVIGTPGAGKSYFVIRHIIDQHIRKGFTMFIYDFKYDDLTRIAYNKLLRYRKNYPVLPRFYVINFEDPSRSHRCNPLDPAGMKDITDATEASRTIMLGLNREWIKKQGDFFVESAINFLTAIIWFLRKYRNGKYCTLPHVIELMQTDYDPLFAVLRQEDEIWTLINPFVSALLRKAAPQLEGQVASAKIGLARLASPQLYYILSGNDFTLDVNNPLGTQDHLRGQQPAEIANLRRDALSVHLTDDQAGQPQGAAQKQPDLR